MPPLNQKTINWLEVCEALILSRLFSKIDQMKLNISEFTLWSDSRIVLAWIRDNISDIYRELEGFNWSFPIFDLTTKEPAKQAQTVSKIKQILDSLFSSYFTHQANHTRANRWHGYVLAKSCIRGLKYNKIYQKIKWYNVIKAINRLY